MWPRKSDDEKFLDEFVAGTLTGFVVVSVNGDDEGGTFIKTGPGESPGALIIWRNKADAAEFANRQGSQFRVKEVSFDSATKLSLKSISDSFRGLRQ